MGLLTADLAVARAAGAGAAELVPDDVTTFARELAAAHGIGLDEERLSARTPASTVEPSPGALVGAGLLGASVGMLVGWYVFLVGTLSDLLYDRLEVVGAVICLVLTGALVAGGMTAALLWVCRNAPGARRLAVKTAAEGVAGGLLGLLVAVLFAGSTDYSTQPEVVLVEVGLVAAGCSVTVLAGRRWVPVRESVARGG